MPLLFCVSLLSLLSFFLFLPVKYTAHVSRLDGGINIIRIDIYYKKNHAAKYLHYIFNVFEENVCKLQTFSHFLLVQLELLFESALQNATILVLLKNL